MNSWSILVPEALMGVAAVGLLYATVKRRFGPQRGLLAGGVLALTPVATLMFRFNNPDALLVLLLVASAYTLTRAMEKAETKWMLWTGVLIGFGFLTKMLQAFLVVPGFALVYLIAAPTSLWRRRASDALRRRRHGRRRPAGGSRSSRSGPRTRRPYIGGSQDNSILNLIFGYNGFGRITGNETGSVGGGGGAAAPACGASPASPACSTAEIGGQISWLIPTALIFLVGLLWLSRRMPRTDGRRAALLLWGTLAARHRPGLRLHVRHLPPVLHGGSGARDRRSRRHRRRLAVEGAPPVHGPARARRLASAPQRSGATCCCSAPRPGIPWLRFVVLHGRARGRRLRPGMPRMSRVVAVAVATLAISVGLAGPFAYSVATASTGKSGAIPSAGPARAGLGGFGGGARRSARSGGGGQPSAACGQQCGSRRAAAGGCGRAARTGGRLAAAVASAACSTPRPRRRP